MVDVELLRAGGEHCIACGVGAVETEAVEFGFDLGAALREVLDDPAGDAGDVGNVVVDRVPLDAETSGQFVAQHTLVQRSGRQLGAVEGLSVECGPLAVGPASEVRDEDVGVQMGVAGATGAMPEPGGDEPDARQTAGAELLERCRLRLAIVRPATHEAGFSFEPADRLFDGGVGGFDDLGTHERVGKCVEHADRLRCRERQVEARDTVLPRLDLVAVRGQPGARIEPSEDGSKLIAGDVVVEVERLVGESEPAATGFAGTGVVVVDAVGDLAEVVLLGTHTELPQRQHDSPNRPRSGPTVTRKFGAVAGAGILWCTCATRNCGRGRGFRSVRPFGRSCVLKVVARFVVTIGRFVGLLGVE